MRASPGGAFALAGAVALDRRQHRWAASCPRRIRDCLRVGSCHTDQIGRSL